MKPAKEYCVYWVTEGRARIVVGSPRCQRIHDRGGVLCLDVCPYGRQSNPNPPAITAPAVEAEEPPMPAIVACGREIEVARRKAKMTSYQLGEAVGKGKSTVRLWETGKIWPSEKSAQAIDEALGTSIIGHYGDEIRANDQAAASVRQANLTKGTHDRQGNAKMEEARAIDDQGATFRRLFANEEQWPPLAEALKTWREALGVSRSALSNGCRVNRAAFSKWEAGEYTPREDTIRLVDKAFKTDFTAMWQKEYGQRRAMSVGPLSDVKMAEVLATQIATLARGGSEREMEKAKLILELHDRYKAALGKGGENA